MLKLRSRSRLNVWYDVINAVFLREIQRRFNDQLGVGWAVISPLIFTLGFAYLRGLRDGGATYGIPSFMFIVFGIVIVQLFLGTFSAVAGSLRRNVKLFGFRSVRPFSIMFAVALFELFITCIIVMALVVLVYFLEIDVRVGGPFTLFASVICAWIIGFSVGGIFAHASSFLPEVAKFQAFVSRPAFFLSGIFFSLNDFPKDYWYLLDWNPLLHAVELARNASYPEYPAEGVSIYFLLQCTLALTLLFSCTYQLTWKKVAAR